VIWSLFPERCENARSHIRTWNRPAGTGRRGVADQGAMRRSIYCARSVAPAACFLLIEARHTTPAGRCAGALECASAIVAAFDAAGLATPISRCEQNIEDSRLRHPYRSPSREPWYEALFRMMDDPDMRAVMKLFQCYWANCPITPTADLAQMFPVGCLKLSCRHAQASSRHAIAATSADRRWCLLGRAFHRFARLEDLCNSLLASPVAERYGLQAR